MAQLKSFRTGAIALFGRGDRRREFSVHPRTHRRRCRRDDDGVRVEMRIKCAKEKYQVVEMVSFTIYMTLST